MFRLSCGCLESLVRTNQEAFELTARTRLINELISDGVNVALPVAAGEIDVLASVESPNIGRRSNPWIPIKLLAVEAHGLLRNRLKTTRASGLLVVTVSSLRNSDTLFALTPAELTVLKMITLITSNGAGDDCRMPAPVCTADRILKLALKPFAMSSGQWRKKVMAAIANASITRGHSGSH